MLALFPFPRVGDTKIIGSTNTINDVNAMKDRLAKNGPQISGMAVYTDFYYYKSGIYKNVSGDLEGYHCICVVGYDDNDGCWICKNSWGTQNKWGEPGGSESNGWFRIAYGECGIQDVFGMWDMEVSAAPTTPHPTPEPHPAPEPESGYAQYVAVDYQFNSSKKVLYAYAGGAWRYKILSGSAFENISVVTTEPPTIYVTWMGDELLTIRFLNKIESNNSG